MGKKDVDRHVKEAAGALAVASTAIAAPARITATSKPARKALGAVIYCHRAASLRNLPPKLLWLRRLSPSPSRLLLALSSLPVWTVLPVWPAPPPRHLRRLFAKPKASNATLRSLNRVAVENVPLRPSLGEDRLPSL